MCITILSGPFAEGPAAVAVETGGARLRLDLGRGSEPGAEAPLAGVGRVDAVLLTHGHVDHAGALDRLGELGHPPERATAELRALRTLPPGRDVAALAASRDRGCAGRDGSGGARAGRGPPPFRDPPRGSARGRSALYAGSGECGEARRSPISEGLGSAAGRVASRFAGRFDEDESSGGR